MEHRHRFGLHFELKPAMMENMSARAVAAWGIFTVQECRA